MSNAKSKIPPRPGISSSQAGKRLLPKEKLNSLLTWLDPCGKLTPEVEEVSNIYVFSHKFQSIFYFKKKHPPH